MMSTSQMIELTNTNPLAMMEMTYHLSISQGVRHHTTQECQSFYSALLKVTQGLHQLAMPYSRVIDEWTNMRIDPETLLQIRATLIELIPNLIQSVVATMIIIRHTQHMQCVTIIIMDINEVANLWLAVFSMQPYNFDENVYDD